MKYSIRLQTSSLQLSRARIIPKGKKENVAALLSTASSLDCLASHNGSIHTNGRPNAQRSLNCQVERGAHIILLQQQTHPFSFGSSRVQSNGGIDRSFSSMVEDDNGDVNGSGNGNGDDTKYSSSDNEDSGSLLSLLDDDNDTSDIVDSTNNRGLSGIIDSSTSSSDFANTSSSSPMDMKRKKKHPPRVPSPNSGLIPEVPSQQTNSNGRMLFDYIAPHVEIETIHKLLDKMKEFETSMKVELTSFDRKQLTNKRRSKGTTIPVRQQKLYKSLIGRVNAFFALKKSRGKRKPDITLDDAPWIKILVAQFFSGAAENHQSSPSSLKDIDGTMNMEALMDDPTFTPNLNRKNREEVVSILMRAREMTLESPLLWSKSQDIRKYRSKKWKEQKGISDDEADDSDSADNSSEDDIQYSKTPEKLRKEAEALANLLAFRLPSSSHDKLIERLEEYADFVASQREDDENERSPSEPKKEGMKMLYNNVHRCLGFHRHLVALDVASFLNVDLPANLQDEYDGSNNDPDIQNLQVVRSDSRILEAWDEWNELRDEVMKVFVSSQHMYCRLHNTKLRPEKKKNEGGASLEEKEVKKIMIKYSKEEHARVENLRIELDRLRTASDGSLVGRNPIDEAKLRGPVPKKGKNLRYECLLLNNSFGPYSSANEAYLADLGEIPDASIINPEVADEIPDTSKTIYLENLPIDITNNELKYLYSRCGTISSVDIFNLRPDLDPGELNEGEKKELMKRDRKSGLKSAGQYRIKRTPVYARIQFEDEDGYDAATIDMLRIFGMVIRRHAVKTIPARNIQSIYIEDIPPGFFAIDLEEKLSNILNPYMYISLKLGQHVNSQPKSCQIRFPTFEVAHFAFEKLRGIHFGEEKCNIHFMKTPENANEYWTRDCVPEP